LQGIVETKNSCLVRTLGGDLEVKFDRVLEKNFYNIWLEGPAELVFNGSIEIQE
jgi:diaminopimelate epimerase